MYVLQLMDTYAASWSVFLMAITECAIIAWIYGTAQWNLTWDVRWWACFFVWFLLCPVVVSSFVVMEFVHIPSDVNSLSAHPFPSLSQTCLPLRFRRNSYGFRPQIPLLRWLGQKLQSLSDFSFPAF